MRYNTEAAVSVLPAGEYQAAVKFAKDKTSKAGSDMIEVCLIVYGPNGAQVDVFDYLLSLDAWQWKVRHFCESAGLDYERGSLDAYECEGKSVRVRLMIDKREGFPEANKVGDYLPFSREGEAAGGTGGTPVDVDSDIPF